MIKVITKPVTKPKAKIEEAVPVKETVKEPELLGLDQYFLSKDRGPILLRDFLIEGDWYELKSRKRIVHILTHAAVQKISREAGITSTPEYTMMVQPSTTNNYTFVIQIRITDHTGRQTVDLGESNRNNLGLKGRSNPANMAQKRAFDRAVFNHLGITGLLGEDEIQDEEDTEEMEKLTPEESQVIAPLINELFAAKTKSVLSAFSNKMKKEKDKYSDKQLEVLRGLYKKKLAEGQKSF